MQQWKDKIEWYFMYIDLPSPSPITITNPTYNYPTPIAIPNIDDNHDSTNNEFGSLQQRIYHCH